MAGSSDCTVSFSKWQKLIAIKSLKTVLEPASATPSAGNALTLLSLDILQRPPKKFNAILSRPQQRRHLKKRGVRLSETVGERSDRKMVGSWGLEPQTSTVSRWRSNQLSYEPTRAFSLPRRLPLCCGAPDGWGSAFHCMTLPPPATVELVLS